MIAVMPVVPRGPLAGAVLERLSVWLAAERYAAGTAAQALSVARGLSAWMEDHGVGLAELTVDAIDAFAADHDRGVAGHALVAARLPTLRRFLIEAGVLAGAPFPLKRGRSPVRKPVARWVDAVDSELEAWAGWQRDERGISEGCIRHRRAWAGGLVESLRRDDAINWGACDVALVNAFIVARAAGYSPASRALIVDATRSMMRWALASGRIGHDLTGGILRARRTRSRLPQGLSPTEMSLLLAACDPATVVGLRDRAVIVVLSRLGLRAGEAASLSLDDIGWAAGRVTVVGKGQRRLTLPIPVDVGEALVAWLHARPVDAADRSVFVRLRAPVGALTSAGISDIVKHRADDAGIGLVHAHRLRHTAAMNVIAAGGALVEAQELLGHKSTISTRVYARTDLESLRTLTVPFGQVPR